LVVVTIVSIANLIAPFTAGAITFGPPVNLSNNVAFSFGSAVVASGSNVYVVWQEDSDLVFTRSTDHGDTFPTLTALFESAIEDLFPAMASYGDNVYVIWEDLGHILFKRSIDGGASFSFQAARLDNETLAEFPVIATSGTNVYVAWDDLLEGKIFFRRSTDNGTSFSSAVSFFSTLGESFEPALAASGSNVYLAWQDFHSARIVFTRSTDNGTSFSDQQVSFLGMDPEFPVLAAFGNNVYLAWQDEGDIFFSRSTNNGVSFPGRVKLGGNSSSMAPALAASGSSVYVVWEQQTDIDGNNTDIIFLESTDNGQSFGQPMNLSDEPLGSFDPAIAVSSRVYVSWDQDMDMNIPPSNADTFLAKSTSIPVAVDQNVSTDEDVPLMITLNGTDVDGATLTFSKASDPSHGMLEPIGAPTCSGSIPNVCSAQVTYTPDLNFNGADSFMFRVSNGAASSNATVSIAVNAVNDAPVANGANIIASLNTAKQILLTGADPENALLAFAIANDPENGTLSTIVQINNNTARVTYTPNLGFIGSDSFTFRINDGVNDSNIATVNIIVQELPLIAKGDPDGMNDGTKLGDITLTIDFFLQRKNPTDEQLFAADIDPGKDLAPTCGNGQISLGDITALIDVFLQRKSIELQC
jgi:hypothetical protein